MSMPEKILPIRVNAVGPKDAKIVIIGEAPGADEEISQPPTPFVGSAGKLLNSCLKQAGLNREEIYITNVVKYRPPDNKLPRLEELGISLDACVKELHQELLELSPTVIIPLGNTALAAVCGLTGIYEYRGSILRAIYNLEQKVIPSLHPAGILRGAIEDSFFLIADLKKAKKESGWSDFRSIPVRNFILKPTFEEVCQCLDEIYTSWTYVSLDIENDKYTGIIEEIGIGDHGIGAGHFALTIPIVKNEVPAWSQEQEKVIWQKLRFILTAPWIYKIIQNAYHEMDYLFPWVGEIYPIFMDTMIGMHLAYNPISKSLETMSSLFTNEPFYKGFKDRIDYNAKDVAVTYEIAMEIFENELKPLGLDSFLLGYQMPFFHIMWRASKVSLRVDKDKMQVHANKTIAELKTFVELLHSIIGRELNVNSPKEVKQYLYDELKLPVQRKKGKITTDEDAIEKLATKFSHPALKVILKIRGLSKLLGTYLDPSILESNGRMRSRWLLTGTDTGRLSSRQNAWGRGCNLQNQPAEIRDIYISDKGTTFLVGDMSQVEARFVAWLSGDITYKSMFKQGGDIHKRVASWIFKTDPTLVTSDQRKKAKATAHGSPYGITHKKISVLYSLPEKEAEWLLHTFHQMFPAVRSVYQLGIQQELSKTRQLKNIFGRRRLFLGYWNEDLFREGYSTKPQSSAVDLINMAGVRIYYRCPSADILIQCHDELVIQVPDEDVKKVGQVFQEEVECPVVVNGDNLSIPLELKTGKTWAKNGLKEFSCGEKL